jgi:hypothetical protein
MTNLERGSVSVSREVSVSAQEFWDMLRDWPAVQKWHPPVDDPPFIGATLKEGHDSRTLPCTRLMHFKSSNAAPAAFEETLLHADAEAKRIYYSFNGFRDRMRNYLATTTVDDLGNGRAYVTCASSFDVPEGASLEHNKAFLAAIYENLVIKGIEAAVKRERSHG